MTPLVSEQHASICRAQPVSWFRPAKTWSDRWILSNATVFTSRTRLRLWHDLLAPSPRLAAREHWDLIHFALLDWLARGGFIDWSRAIVDSCSVPAVCGGPQTGPNPTDRAKRGSKRHLICDARQRPWRSG